MHCCLINLFYYFNNNKINHIDESIDEAILSKNTNIIDKNLDIDKNNDSDKYLIINNNIYTECNICLEVTLLENIKMLYPCGHRLYCDLCIKNIKICPYCRSNILEKVKIYEI